MSTNVRSQDLCMHCHPAENISFWKIGDILIVGPDGTLYEGGFFRAKLLFPKDYPTMPPKMKFITPIWHPNVFSESGEVCISILHPPGEDKYGYEEAGERWLPVHTVESIGIFFWIRAVSPH
jgi:ubiquitin-protein ligase